MPSEINEGVLYSYMKKMNLADFKHARKQMQAMYNALPTIWQAYHNKEDQK
jgi:hypothetical protein